MSPWNAVFTAAALYYLTGGLGICLGYHRLLTHRSFHIPRWLEYIIVTLGVLALQGDPIEWVATHRAHHAYSDTPQDPHDARKGFLWSHFSWLVAYNPARLCESEMMRFALDLYKDPYYRFLRKTHPIFTVILSIVLWYAGGPAWLVWGICVRLVVTYHVTWLVNSAAHAEGYQSYESGDISTNNWWVALLAWGEGWHNNHHAFPASARHGLRWFEVDITWLAIRCLQGCRLATKVQVPKSYSLHRKAKIHHLQSDGLA